MLDYNTWIENFENLLAYITTEWDGALLIMGELNIDLLDYHSTRTAQNKNKLYCYNLSEHVQLPISVNQSINQSLFKHEILS